MPSIFGDMEYNIVLTILLLAAGTSIADWVWGKLADSSTRLSDHTLVLYNEYLNVNRHRHTIIQEYTIILNLKTKHDKKMWVAEKFLVLFCLECAIQHRLRILHRLSPRCLRILTISNNGVKRHIHLMIYRCRIFLRSLNSIK